MVWLFVKKSYRIYYINKTIKKTKNMKRFILLSIPEITEEMKLELKKDIEDCLKTADCESCPSRDTCQILAKEVENYILNVSDVNNFEDVKHIIQIIQKHDNPSTIIVIDSQKDVCYIYKTKYSIETFKKTLLPQILQSYEDFFNQFPFAGTIEDVRYLLVDPMLN